MTELKSRGVKMLPSKDNQHKISVCKYQPRILHSPANEGSKNRHVLRDKGVPRINMLFFSQENAFFWRGVQNDAQTSCDKNANDCRQSYKGSWLSQQNLFRFMASSPASFTCCATQQLAHQRPLASEMPETNVHARGRRSSRTLECPLWLQLAVVSERWQLSTVDAGSILSGVSMCAPWRTALTCSPPGTWRCSLCFQTQMFHSSKKGMTRWPSGLLIPGWKMEPIK